MTPHQLGLSLRDEVLRQRQRTGRAQGPRLVAVIRDLCAEDHQDFCAPLCFLVTSSVFASAVERDPTFAGPALLHAWNQELRQIYASGLCQRLQPVLAGLLSLPPPGAAASASPQPPGASSSVAAPASPLPSAGPTEAPLPSRPQDPRLIPVATAERSAPAPGRFAGAKTILLIGLAFLGGVLLPLALALGLGIGIGRKPSPSPTTAAMDRGLPVPRPQPPPSQAPAIANPPQIPAPTTASASPEPAVTPATIASAEDTAAAQQRAIRRVEQLYEALVAKDYDRARGFVSAEAADQFQPGSLEAYEQVSIQDLRVTSQSGSTVELEGVVSLVQPDGSRHLETRSFSVDVASDPAIISASAFGRVLP
jgi:hypothetical protein